MHGFRRRWSRANLDSVAADNSEAALVGASYPGPLFVFFGIHRIFNELEPKYAAIESIWEGFAGKLHRGESEIGVRPVNSISHLRQTESPALDHDQLGALYAQLGAIAADDVLRRTMEELALRLTQAEKHYRDQDFSALRKNVHLLISIAAQIGMCKLSMVADDVVTAIDQTDDIAIAATVFRLIRVGERSLSAMWDLQDLTI